LGIPNFSSGLDASIQFESDREENLGIFVNVTVKQFAFFQSAFLSLADLIGVVRNLRSAFKVVSE
jgi:hypothetical protein